jgi:hypothetical protein
MLAPPERRAADRRRKTRQLERRRKGLRRCTLWISDHALEGLITQLVTTGKLTDRQASHHAKLESAIADLLEEQGRSLRLMSLTPAWMLHSIGSRPMMSAFSMTRIHDQP